MKRDLDLARQILAHLEKDSDADGKGCVEVQIEGREEREISYHVMLLYEDGLVDARNASDGDGLCWMPMRLTSAGHEFLEASRDDGHWENAKKTVKEKGGGLSFELVKALLIKWATDRVFGT
jgi:DNA-binding transcriptional ArsR family regulator